MELDSCYGQLFELHSSAQLIIDAEMIIRKANKAFLKIVSIDDEKKIIGMKITGLKEKGIVKYLSNSGDSFDKAIERKTITFGRSNIETEVGFNVIERQNIPLMNDSGTVEYVIIIYTIVTEIVKTGDYFSNQISKMMDSYKKVADGDLSIEHKLDLPDKDTESAYNNLKILNDAIANIVSSLKNNFIAINEAMNMLMKRANEAIEASESIKVEIGKISNSSSNVSGNMEKINNISDQVSRAMGDLSAATQEIASSMVEVSTQTELAEKTSQSGLKIAQENKNGTEKIEEIFSSIQGIISETEEQMKGVAKTTTVIQDISRQTNLLALNAAIEAARAGDSGRGFAVVAGEVKSLAQDSKKSAEKIEEVIKNLGSLISNATKKITENHTTVTKGIESSQEAYKAFSNIAEAVGNVNISTSEVASAAEEQTAGIEESAASINEVSNFVSSTAKESLDVSQSVEEVATGINNVLEIIVETKGAAEEVLNTISKFKW
jgi:methyl-accepting chemotaxis protein